METNSVLTKKDIVKSFWLWMFFSHSNYNYERLQAMGVVHGMSPILKKLYGKDVEQMKEACQRHMEFFNTEPHFGSCIIGISIAMEEQKSEGAPISSEMINGIKTGLMGPIAGIGDTLWQGTLVPIILSFAISIAASGNVFGPLIYILLLGGIMTAITYLSFTKGYYLGKEGIQKILSEGILQKVMGMAQTLGGIVLGALTASFVGLSSTMEFKIGATEMALQKDILDQLFKGLLPLSVTLLTLFMLQKKMKPNKVLLVLVLIGLVGGLLGIF